MRCAAALAAIEGEIEIVASRDVKADVVAPDCGETTTLQQAFPHLVAHDAVMVGIGLMPAGCAGAGNLHVEHAAGLNQPVHLAQSEVRKDAVLDDMAGPDQVETLRRQVEEGHVLLDDLESLVAGARFLRCHAGPRRDAGGGVIDGGPSTFGRILVRADKEIDISAYLRAWSKRVKTPPSVRVSIDVEPYSFI